MKKFIGPRLWKTGLAVTITVFLMNLTGHSYIYGSIAAALAMTPSAGRSLKASLNQIGANILGGVIGVVSARLFGTHPLVIGATVMFVLLLCRALKWDVSNVVITVTLFVMAPHTESTSAYAAWRLVSVVVGAVVGTAVNRLVAPPDYRPLVLEAITEAGRLLDQFILTVVELLPEPERYTKEQVLAESARVEKAIGEAARLAGLMQEWGADSRGVRPEVTQRAIKVLGSLLERALVIHKAALTAQKAADYRQQLPAMSAALGDLVIYRRRLYGALSGEAVPAELPAALLDLERQFETPAGLPGSPAEVETFFRLHRMASGISYMANRLSRLHVAMAAGTAAAAAAAAAAATTTTATATAAVATVETAG